MIFRLKIWLQGHFSQNISLQKFVSGDQIIFVQNHQMYRGLSHQSRVANILPFLSNFLKGSFHPFKEGNFERIWKDFERILKGFL